MNFLCKFLGHKFTHAKKGFKTTGVDLLGQGFRTFEGLVVDKKCDRCGYEDSDTFEIPNPIVRPS